MSRELHDHEVTPASKLLSIEVMDPPGDGGACHAYQIHFPIAFEGCSQMPPVYLHFQNGTIPDVGINGITEEALLAILIDRLRGFQAGPYSCPENAAALEGMESALRWLAQRTRKRTERTQNG